MQLLGKFCFVCFWPRIILFWSGGRLGWGGWLEKVKIKLTQLPSEFKLSFATFPWEASVALIRPTFIFFYFINRYW